MNERIPSVRPVTRTRDAPTCAVSPDARNAEVGQIALLDDHGIARAEARDVALDDIPGAQAPILVIGADQHDDGRPARWACATR